MQTVFSMRTALRYFELTTIILFSLIFLQSTLFKTDTYEADTNKGAFHLSELTGQTQDPNPN